MFIFELYSQDMCQYKKYNKYNGLCNFEGYKKVKVLQSENTNAQIAILDFIKNYNNPKNFNMIIWLGNVTSWL